MMKRVLFALLICCVFSMNAQARKTMITNTNPGELCVIVDANECVYKSTESFTSKVHFHKNNALGFKRLIGDEEWTLWSKGYRGNPDVIGIWYFGSMFNVKKGDSWSLVWVLERTNGKGRIIDAIEQQTGICEPSGAQAEPVCHP